MLGAWHELAVKEALPVLHAVSPWLSEKPKNAMILEAPWFIHLPKLILLYVRSP